MITDLEITNFKGHRNTKLKLGAFTALVGPNGGGKSSVLQALHLLGKTVETNPAGVFAGNLQPVRVITQRENDLGLSARGTHGGEPWRFELRFTRDPEKDSLPSASSNWSVGSLPPGGNSGLRVGPGGGGSWPMPDSPHQRDILGDLSRCIFVRLDADEIAKPGPLRSGMTLGGNGSNTSAMLARLKLKAISKFLEVQERLRIVVPSLEEISIDLAEHSSDVHYEVSLRMKGGVTIPASSASEGTLLCLGLFTAMVQDEPPRLVLLDDIDRGLHPTAQLELVKQLREIQKTTDLQIIATTHSAYILDALKPEEVIALVTDEQGTVHSRSLAEHPVAKGAAAKPEGCGSLSRRDIKGLG